MRGSLSNPKCDLYRVNLHLRGQCCQLSRKYPALKRAYNLIASCIYLLLFSLVVRQVYATIKRDIIRAGYRHENSRSLNTCITVPQCAIQGTRKVRNSLSSIVRINGINLTLEWKSDRNHRDHGTFQSDFLGKDIYGKHWCEPTSVVSLLKTMQQGHATCRLSIPTIVAGHQC